MFHAKNIDLTFTFMTLSHRWLVYSWSGFDVHHAALLTRISKPPKRQTVLPDRVAHLPFVADIAGNGQDFTALRLYLRCDFPAQRETAADERDLCALAREQPRRGFAYAELAPLIQATLFSSRRMSQECSGKVSTWPGTRAGRRVPG